jgi:hypothetical protein
MKKGQKPTIFTTDKAIMRIPPHSDHSFRYKLTTDSAAL